MKKLTSKQRTVGLVLTFVLVIPLAVFYLLDEKGVFDTRSSASVTLTGEFVKADLNNDEKVSIADFSIWLSSYRAFKANSSSYTKIGDLDNDGAIKISDFSIWLNLWRAHKGSGLDGDLCGSGENCQSGVCTLLYRDSDGDGYGTNVLADTEEGSGSMEGDNGIKTVVIGPSNRIGFCGSTASEEGYVDNNDDCYDRNLKANPGAVGCFTVDRGDGSFDYNCDGESDKCPIEVLCEDKWWFDNDTKVCSQKNFCGEYMYYGLQVFGTSIECQKALSARNEEKCNYNPSNMTEFFECTHRYCDWKGGVWVEEYKECEGLLKTECTVYGVDYGCLSPCRYSENSSSCTEECVEVCSFRIK